MVIYKTDTDLLSKCHFLSNFRVAVLERKHFVFEIYECSIDKRLNFVESLQNVFFLDKLEKSLILRA